MQQAEQKTDQKAQVTQPSDKFNISNDGNKVSSWNQETKQISNTNALDDNEEDEEIDNKILLNFNDDNTSSKIGMNMHGSNSNTRRGGKPKVIGLGKVGDNLDNFLSAQQQ